ncbi:aldo-keto reductase/ oxidoreductase [Panicum miliaceum]|uniref:Aldo-keto reductase/ oxidoreductase n=1 Tax=Panicum miliaceum TaxID=4540 RepID=A0A3L6PTQ1_PANMI|nr:aldo-keto reductase/ oxidoreductase [Panicum miliaceum]
MYRPPHPYATAGGRTGVKETARWTSPIPQFAQGIEDPEMSRSEAGTDVVGVGLMRNRVVPPTGLDDRMPQDLLSSEEVPVYNLSSGELRFSTSQEKRLGDAHARLKKRGVPLAANQVNYSLIYRTPELNGVKAACEDLSITLIAYSPISQGVLTRKYTPENPPTGPRANTYTPEFLTKLQPLMSRIKEIGPSYGKSPTQVSLNWLTCQENMVPIPRAKNASQAKEFAGALRWSLTSVRRQGQKASDSDARDQDAH